MYKNKFWIVAVFVFALLLAACGGAAAPAPAPAEAPAPAAEEPASEPAATMDEDVTLTMGSWRVDDVAQMNAILDAFHAEHPNITINFDPTNPPEYNAVLRTQLEGGTAPDLFYLRSFSTSRQLFEEGFLEPLNDVAGVKEAFTPASIAPWATDAGEPYGVPFIAVSHGIYYNQDIFDELDLAIPTNWAELMTTAQALQDAGYDAFANASGDEWTIAEIVFMNLAPNFIGGLEGRLAYLSGERCFNDENAVAAFQAVADLAPFLPDGQEALTYYDSQQLFLQGEAGMWMGGSWDIPFFEAEAPDFGWSVFAMPATEGDPEYVTFHLDAGMGLNAASEHKDAAKVFLEWMTTDEMAQMLANQLPGFFPIHTNAPAVENEHAATFLGLNEGRGLDVRWAWPALLDGAPDGYTLMQEGAVGIVNGTTTPQEAADALQEGLAQWFEPAQNCGQGAAAMPAEPMEDVTLTMGSWRVDDVAQMNAILDAFQAEHPNITINFDPTNPPEYNAVLRTQLEGGTAPDLFYLRSFSTSRQLFEEGFLEPLDDIDALATSFTPAALSPWATDDGMPYGVPFIAVSHGIYYNQNIFDELGLAVPTTWAELLTTAQALQDAGYDAFANASGDEWTIAEIVFMNLAPNFIGGREGRLAYLSGDRCFNDENAVAAFQAVADLAPYLPDGQEALTYYDSQQLFLLGEAGMWMGGSWDIPFFEAEAPDFDWSVFAVPAPEGQDEFVTFHMDAGMGLNAASEHQDAAKVFLEWMASDEMAQLLANQLPGFFPIHTNAPAVENEHANTFLALNEGRGLDVRWAWPVLLDGVPDGYTLMQEGAVGIVNGTTTPQEAADALQEGLAQWFEPAQNCGQ